MDLDNIPVTVYSYIMGKQDKLLLRARNNPRGLKFSDFFNLMRFCNWTLDHQTGSHQIWYSPRKQRISIQNRNGMAKEYQVKQFLAIVDEDNKNDE